MSPTTDHRQRIIIFTWTCLFTFMCIAPVSAVRFVPFLSGRKTISPQEYSKRQENIEAFNKQAIELFEDGQFEAAQELWEKAIEMMEGMGPVAQDQHEFSDLINDEYELPNISGKTSDVDEMYQEAVSLFRKQRYVASKKMFEKVESRIPDHKATRNYLSILEHKIKQTQQSLSTDKIQENIYSRQVERDEWERILLESERELEKKIIQQVDPLYEEALTHYKKRRFALAKDYFQEINDIKPGFKDTTKYLARVDADIKEEQQRAAQEEYKKKVLARKQEHEEWQNVIKESEEKLAQKMKEQAEPIYQEALFYYKQREFDLAKSHFEEVEMIVPGYKAVDKYLGRIEQDIQKEILRRQKLEAQELARRHKQEEAQRKREAERQAALKAQEDKIRMQQFKDEVAARRLERREWLKVLEEGEKERQQKLKAQADFVYREAIEFYKKRRFKQAKEDFLEVEQIIPNYKSTPKYIARIDKDIEEEDQQALLEQQRLLQRQMREEHYAEMKQQEKEQMQRAIEDKRRLHEFKERTMARKQKRDEWERLLKKNQMERDRRLKEEAEFIYKDAITAYKNKEWDRARAGFIEAGEIWPGYKKSEKYIARIERDVMKEQEHIQNKIAKENEALRRKEELARKAEEERQKKLQLADQKRQEQYNKTQADIAYRYALSLYERQKYAQAKDKFLEVQDLVPGYKSTKRYLARIDVDMETAAKLKRRDHELASRRDIREEEITKQKEIEQFMRSEEKKRLKELKEEAKARKAEREEWERTIAKIEKENQKRLAQQADSIYKEALRYYEAGWYAQARETFHEVEAIRPDYKSTKKYLTKVEKKIVQDAQQRAENEQKIENQLIDDAVIDQREQLMAESWRRELVKNERDKRLRRHQKIKSGRNEYDVPEFQENEAISEAIIQRDNLIAENAEIKYREALDSYKAKRFIEAKLKFIEVESFSPGYKATLDYLENIDEVIEHQKMNLASEEQTRSMALRTQRYEEPYNERRHNIVEQALAHQEQIYQKYDVSISDQKKIKKTKRKRTKNWEQKVRDRRKELKKQRRQVAKQYEKQFRQLYNRAIALYKKGAYREAKKLFLQIDRMKPGYKKTSSYIKKTNAKIAKGIEKQVDTEMARTQWETERNMVVGAALDAFE